MTVTLELNEDTARELQAKAAASGVSLQAYLLDLAGTRRDVATPMGNESSALAFDLALDELFAGDTRPLPPSASTYSREDLYTDHD